VIRIRRLLAAHVGMALRDVPDRELAEAVRARADATQASLEAYEARLDPAELRALAQHLTVGETFFFRQRGHFEVVRDLLARRPYVHALSAGCASGEEPYSLVMTLDDARPAMIHAVDLNERALAKARRGVYSPWSLRETRALELRRWFRRDGEAYELASEVRSRVTFEANSLTDIVLPERLYDVVFCRNVLMYLTAAAAREVVARLARALVPGGLLFLGHAETIHGLSEAFALRSSHGVFYYAKGPR